MYGVPPGPQPQDVQHVVCEGQLHHAVEESEVEASASGQPQSTHASWPRQAGESRDDPLAGTHGNVLDDSNGMDKVKLRLQGRKLVGVQELHLLGVAAVAVAASAR